MLQAQLARVAEVLRVNANVGGAPVVNNLNAVPQHAQIHERVANAMQAQLRQMLRRQHRHHAAINMMHQRHRARQNLQQQQQAMPQNIQPDMRQANNAVRAVVNPPPPLNPPVQLPLIRNPKRGYRPGDYVPMNQDVMDRFQNRYLYPMMAAPQQALAQAQAQRRAQAEAQVQQAQLRLQMAQAQAQAFAQMEAAQANQNAAHRHQLQVQAQVQQAQALAQQAQAHAQQVQARTQQARANVMAQARARAADAEELMLRHLARQHRH